MERKVGFEIWTTNDNVWRIYMGGMWTVMGDLFSQIEYLAEGLKKAARDESRFANIEQDMLEIAELLNKASDLYCAIIEQGGKDFHD